MNTKHAFSGDSIRTGTKLAAPAAKFASAYEAVDGALQTLRDLQKEVREGRCLVTAHDAEKIQDAICALRATKG